MKQTITFLTTIMFCVQAFAQDTNTSNTSNSYIMYATIVFVFIIIWLLNTKFKKRTKAKIFGVFFGIYIIAGIIIVLPKIVAEQSSPKYDEGVVWTVKSLNSHLPQKIQEGVYGKKWELKDSCLIYVMEIDENKRPFEDFMGDTNLKKRIIFNSLVSSSYFLLSPLSDIAHKGFSFKILIKGIQSHREIAFNANPSEIQKAQYGKDISDKEKLHIYLSNLKRTLPSQMGNGITLSNAAIIKDKFVITYTIDENIYYDMKAVSEKELESDLKSDFQNGRILPKLGVLLAPLNMAIRVLYVGSITKKQTCIDIPASYIQQVVSNNSQN